MGIADQIIKTGIDRFKKIRVGQIISDIDDRGCIDVRWLDCEAGGQSNILISYPAYDNINSWGVEYGFSKGMVGIFGFLEDNHAVLLTTIISKIPNKNVGYDKTKKIKSGEIRLTSLKNAQIYFDLLGNLFLKTSSLCIKLNETEQKIEITAPNGLWINNVKYV